MYTKKIYFSGGSFYELQEVFSRVPGVISTTCGYIDSDTANPDYNSVLNGESGAAFGVEVEFDPKKIDISMLMDILFSVINPYVKDKQGDCEGHMYRSGVYYVQDEDEPMVAYHMNFIHNRQKALAVTEANITINDPNSAPVGARRCYAAAGYLKNFTSAGVEHQHYLKKHPETKTRIDFELLIKLKVIE